MSAGDVSITVCLFRQSNWGGEFVYDRKLEMGLRIKITSCDYLSTLNFVNDITAAWPKTICPTGISCSLPQHDGLACLGCASPSGHGRSPFFAVSRVSRCRPQRLAGVGN